MIVSRIPNRKGSRWLHACVLLCAVAVLPLELAVAQDYEAVEKRLSDAVAAGELSQEQADAMMAALRRSDGDEDGFEEWLEAVGERLKAAVASGEMTEEEAWTEWYKFKEAEVAPRLKAAVRAGEMSEEEAWGIWHAIGQAEAAERLKTAVARGEMTEEEARAKWAEITGESRRDRDDMRRRMIGALMENGIPREHVEDVMGVLRPIVGEMRREGDAFELDPGVRQQLEGMDLSAEQIDFVVGLARRLASSRGDDVEDVAALGVRCCYYVSGEIHVNTLGTPEGQPLTSGHSDFKPSWSKTGDMLIFFRRTKDNPVVTNWKTAICVINVDGTGFHKLTDGTHTDFNPTWTRDGSNTPIWNRKNPATGGFYVMRSQVGNHPGEEVAISDKRYHTWAYTCLTDGRILVQSAHPEKGWGYFLMMTPRAGGESRYERIDCDGLAKKGLLDRISVSPSEKKVCFDHHAGHVFRETGRTIFIADFDADKRTITNVEPIANEKPEPTAWYAYPRWVKDETAVVYHANTTGKGALYLYTVKDGTTRRVSTDPRADYRYPHGERSPK